MSTQDCAVEFKEVGRDGINRAFETLVEIMADGLRTARVDAYSDEDSLPPDAEEAKRALLEIGQRRRPTGWRRLVRQRAGDRGMAILLDLADPRLRSVLKAFGPYSIHVEVFGGNRDEPVITAHDSGLYVMFQCNEDLLHKFLGKSGLPSEAVHMVAGTE